MRGIIYRATNTINGKAYIGQTRCTLAVRIVGHLQRIGKGSTSAFHNAIHKYGIQSFIFTLVDEATTQAILDEKEKYWIKELETLAPNGYNMTDGGEHVTYTEEVLQKLRGHAGWMRGKHHSEETKRKLSAANKGRKKPPFTEQHLRNLSIAHKGQQVSEQRRLQVSIRHKGRQKSAEECRKLAIITKTRWQRWQSEAMELGLTVRQMWKLKRGQQDSRLIQ